MAFFWVGFIFLVSPYFYCITFTFFFNVVYLFLDWRGKFYKFCVFIPRESGSYLGSTHDLSCFFGNRGFGLKGFLYIWKGKCM